ncbi:MAG TPA: DUF2795 domain-containing protein [Frankiaceae bacterium]|jgi:hypothetical protein|nr:DUF2795 domain-containing protein [Frankiaceae bacterium]
MERGSDKHGPHLDEEMAHEVSGVVQGGHETRAEEWHSAEPAGEDQPQVTLGGEAPLMGGTPQGMTAGDVASRSELAQWLGRAVFPAVQQILLEHARDAGAPDNIVEEIRALPAGREYTNVGDVWRALNKSDGGHSESRRF